MTSGVARITTLAVIAAAVVVALSGIPAQAQSYYYSPYYNAPYTNYGPQPYYGASCTTFVSGGVLYRSCPVQPYGYGYPSNYPATYYYPSTYYAPGPYYPGTYFYPGTYYDFAPSRLNGTNNR